VAETQPAEVKPTLLEHVMEIRGRLVKAALFFFIVSLACYGLAEPIFDFLARPAEGHLVYTHPVGGMMAYLKIAFLCGALLTSPYTLYHILAFVGPALNLSWRRNLLRTLAVGYGLFAAGAYFGVRTLPMAMHALMSFDRPGLRAMIDVDQYFKFVFMIVFGLGAAFEAPLLLFFVASMGLVSAETLAKHWRLAAMACLILGAMINPTPDLISWLMVCLPLFLLYFVSIGVVAWAEKRRARAQAPAG
jgi:sec-independent protein translocase protein TatC